MVRSLLVCFFFIFPALVAAEDRLLPLEETVNQREELQPGLENYSAGIETKQLDSLIKRFSAPDPQPAGGAAKPAFTWYWLRGKGSLVSSRNGQPDGAMQDVAEHLSKIFAAGSENSLIPAGKADLRREIAGKATIKTTETQLGDTLLKRIDLSFEQPVPLQEAFYTDNLRLPQNQISKLYFDIDARTHTIQEIGILTVDGLKLTTEIRYHQVTGGFLPERIKVTSPDGSIEDLLEITYGKVEGFSVPSKIVWMKRHPQLQEDFEAKFADYKINQPFPEIIRKQFE
jgi:hypothetical protein